MAKYLLNSRTLIYHHVTKFSRQFKRYMALKQEDIERGSIIIKTDNPFDLFNEWFTEASKNLVYPLPISFVLSSLSAENKITSRLMKFIERKGDSFIFIVNDRTKKIQDMRKYPKISMCFVWAYPKDEHFVLRQVRIEAKVKELSKGKVTEIYNKLPLPLKVDWFMSKQNKPIKRWDARHEHFINLLNDYKDKPIKMPPYITCFSAKPEEIQFFHSILKTELPFLADRVLYEKHGTKWKPIHIGS